IIFSMVAFMLGYLRMNVDQATDELLALTNVLVFDGSNGDIDREKNSNDLTKSLEKMLRTRAIAPETEMKDTKLPSKRSKVVLYAAASTNITHPHIFRTYPSRESSLNPTIIQALRATMAIQSLFPPVKVGGQQTQESFIGGALGANNPTRLLLKEAGEVFGRNRRVAQIISLGCGRPQVLSVELSNAVDADELLKEATIDCEMVANELSTRLFSIDAYLRLNISRGVEPFKMKEWYNLGTVGSLTAAYLATPDVSASINNSLRHLRARIGSVTLDQLSRYFGL
ncbi:hypothetical protein M408DRAFT_83065, partial [Serendipita vermifera MAFF 305830]